MQIIDNANSISEFLLPLAEKNFCVQARIMLRNYDRPLARRFLIKRRWTKVSDQSHDIRGIFQKSNSKFIARTYDGMWEFDSTTEKWEELNIDMEDIYGNTFYSKHTNKFYIYDPKRFIIFDPNKPKSQAITQYSHQYGSLSINGALMFADGKFHVIGGYDSNRHIIFDAETGESEVHHEFKECKQGYFAPGLVHIEAKNELLMIGGYNTTSDESFDIIRKYSLKEKKWSILEAVKLPTKRYDFPYSLTNNQKYLIVFLNGSLYFWKLGTNEFIDISDKLPKKHYFKSMIMTGDCKKDEIIIAGFIRNECKDLVIPVEIMDMIKNWYICEYFHILNLSAARNKSHWKINICDLIPDYER